MASQVNAKKLDTPGRGIKRRLALILLVVAVLGVALTTVWFTLWPKGPRVSHAQKALEHGNVREALRLAGLVLQANPNSRDAVLVAGRAALALRQYEQALGYFREIPEDGSQESIEALVRCANLSLSLGRMTDAEHFLRRVLSHHPDHLEATENLLFLLRLQGRNWESLGPLLVMLRHGRHSSDYLAVAGTLEGVWLDASRDAAYLTFCRQSQPSDPICLLGPARKRLSANDDLDEVKRMLRSIVDTHPHQIEAQAQLGILLFENAGDEEFLTWHAQLPALAEQHPLIWVTRGRWAHRQGETPAAIRCLWEATRRYPNDRAANLLIANLLATIGKEREAAVFRKRGEDLLVFDDLLLRGATTADGRPTTPVATKMIETLERLGRFWEAVGWSRFLLERDQTAVVAQQMIERLQPRLHRDTPLTVASADSALTLDLSDFPLPRWPSASEAAPKTPQPTPQSTVSFEDVAQRVGLEFRYFVDRERLAQRVYTFDFAGGGVGVLDYDGDGWPDLYLTQSCPWPQSDEQHEHLDRLFRNVSGERFEDVTPWTGCVDRDFGQGAAVGDVNSDGFADIYVANLGANRLYVNNGDGTFRDGTASSGTAGDDYSLSAVLADFSGDALPDLYVANYLGGDALTRQCKTNGQLVQCTPKDFPGQQDRLYVNLGDGRFDEVTQQAGVGDPAGKGKGMGVIAADFDGAGGLDLYVANDGTENFLFMNKTDSASGSVRMEEQGSLSGTAYDDLGRPQASMGLAAQDVDQDGRLDIFVTNFFKESNNLFVQIAQPAGLIFNDQALETGLATPSIETMGWGAQFLDGDLDGDWDLVVANGHLDENSSGSAPGPMRPQFFENVGAAKFRELPGAAIGSYFQSKYFGRAVARLDWNRDGTDDVCITHLGAPVALLTNTSERRGRSFAIQLRGVQSSRDAIGSILRITAGGVSRTVQLVAGDGFESSNQRQLTVGVGEHDRVEKLSIHWPSGNHREFEDLPTDREYIFVEGHPKPYVLER